MVYTVEGNGIYARSGTDGSLIWQKDSVSAHGGNAAPKLVDINGDGVQDVISSIRGLPNSDEIDGFKMLHYGDYHWALDFIGMPPRDADGNQIQGKLWTFHPTSLLTKLAKATGCDNILGVNQEDNMDISQLLGKAFYADVSVNSVDSGKKRDDGTPIIYNNVNFKGASKLPMVKGKPLEVEELQVKPVILNHNNVTEETVVLLRGKVLQMMKQAPEYAGSKLEQLLGATQESVEPATAKQEVKAAEHTEREVKNAPPIDFDDDIPFLGYMKGKLSYMV